MFTQCCHCVLCVCVGSVGSLWRSMEACCYFYLQMAPPLTSNTTRFVYLTCTYIFSSHTCLQMHWMAATLPVCVDIKLKHYFPSLPSPEPSAGVGRGDWGRRSLWGHSAPGACPFCPEHQWDKSMLRLCPVPYLQGAASEGRYPGPAGESSPWPQLSGAGLWQDLPLHIQNIHQYHKAYRAALPEVLLL